MPHFNRSICLVALFLVPQLAVAHPGRTAADGCHYCRTNCDKWGVPWNERHCHGGYTAPTPTYTPPPKPSCPANSTLIGGKCLCKDGYAAFQSSCIKIPANAHAATNPSNAWECDAGYIEKGNTCILKPIPDVTFSSSSKTSAAAVLSASASSSSVFSLSRQEMEEMRDLFQQIQNTSKQENNAGTSLLLIAALGGGAYWYWKKKKKS